MTSKMPWKGLAVTAAGLILAAIDGTIGVIDFRGVGFALAMIGVVILINEK